MLSRLLLLLALLSLAAAAQTEPSALKTLLEKPLLDPNQSTVEVQIYTASRVPPLPSLPTADAWKSYAEGLRTRVLDEVVFRGEARRWNQFPGRVEWLDTIENGPGYRIRKLRFEAVPGLWIPALLYEPEKLAGRVPAILNVNGHEGDGKATPYIQLRCINLAKRGFLALNPEWVGKGELNLPNYVHYRMNQLDLTGTSGLSVFYLTLRRALDILSSHAHTDPERLAVTGLSGGGWQTIFLSALDPRVKLANPVAGYSSFVTRAQFPTLDLGDSEQTPSDLATVADYTHLTAMLAPRPALLTYNAKDNCCFRADYAVAPLLQAARGVYALFGAQDRLRHHANHDPGHNYGQDNREAFYRVLAEFFADGSGISTEEIPSEAEVRTVEQLRVELPPGNLDFQSLALQLAARLPHRPELPASRAEAEPWQQARRAELARLVRPAALKAVARPQGAAREGDLQASYWRLAMNGDWTVPAVEFARPGARGATLLVADQGRASQAERIGRLLADGRRVVAIDPFYLGESKIATRDFLFALLVAALGERPLGIQTGQVLAAARWLAAERGAGPVQLLAVGPRSSLFALIAAALDPAAIAGVELEDSFGSLKEIIERNLAANETPELFCFGLLEQFDIPQIAALAAPRPVRFLAPSDRVRRETAALGAFYRLWGAEFPAP